MTALALAPRRAAHALIRFYQLTLSSLIGRQCRYLPTCSAYADEAIARHGLWAGAWMGTARMCRCHPWGGSGFDPPPQATSGRRLVGAAVALRSLALIAATERLAWRLASAAPGLYGRAAFRHSQRDCSAWPSRAAPHASAPRIEGGRFLIVEARFYDAISAQLLEGATRALDAAGASYDLVSVAGALEIPDRHGDRARRGRGGRPPL